MIVVFNGAFGHAHYDTKNLIFNYIEDYMESIKLNGRRYINGERRLDTLYFCVFLTEKDNDGDSL